MALTLAIVTATPHLCQKAIRLAMAQATGEVFVHIFENGCVVPAAPDVPIHARIHSDKNVGDIAGTHALGMSALTDVFVSMHDDVEIYERGWDERFVRRFAESPNCVLAGFGGAHWLGTPEMWTNNWDEEPFRGPYSSNMRAAEQHGPRIWSDQRAVTVDGLGFAVRKSFFDAIGGLSWWPIIHHGHDHALACMARRHGKETWIVPIDCEHYNAATSGSAMWQEQAAKHGGDRALYLRSLVLLKEMFRDVLPMR